MVAHVVAQTCLQEQRQRRATGTACEAASQLMSARCCLAVTTCVQRDFTPAAVWTAQQALYILWMHMPCFAAAGAPGQVPPAGHV